MPEKRGIKLYGIIRVSLTQCGLTNFTNILTALYTAISTRMHHLHASDILMHLHRVKQLLLLVQILRLHSKKGLKSIKKQKVQKLQIYEANVPRSTYTYSKTGPESQNGTFQGAEIPLVLNNLYAQDGYPHGEADRAVADKVSSYWANFIKTAYPNDEVFDGLDEFVTTTPKRIMGLGDNCG